MTANNPCIVSFYMDNINMKTVGLQKSVVEKYNKSKIKHYIMKIGVPHPVGIDYFWAMNGHKLETFKGFNIEKQVDHDVILFLDIDALPLHENAIDFYLEEAASGKIIGNAQRTNHIQNNQHVFAAPSAVAISSKTFEEIGSPSAIETNMGDVAESWTYAAEKKGIKVDCIMPLRYDYPPERYDWEKNQPPYWDLADGMPKYGIGTTYGNSTSELFYHLFQIRFPGQQERFWKKCEEILIS